MIGTFTIHTITVRTERQLINHNIMWIHTKIIPYTQYNKNSHHSPIFQLSYAQTERLMTSKVYKIEAKHVSTMEPGTDMTSLGKKQEWQRN